MVNRNAYDEIISKMKDIASHHSGTDFFDGVSRIEDIRKNFDIKLMVVGHFSAGKTSLLNNFMRKPEFLKEAQEPETAIATELVYAEKEEIFAYSIDDSKEVYNPNKEYTPIKYNCLEYRLNVPALKEIEDFTIVDTPGFDSGIETHAKALANYIGKASAYILVIDQEKGGIDSTNLEFIKEISNYSKQIAILINKCDKITEEVAESIADHARNTLENEGLPYKVYTISKKDTDISEKLISIISKFNAQEAFDKVLTSQIETELINIEKVLSITKNKIFLDVFDFDVDIAKYKRLEEQLSGVFDKKKREIKEELPDKVQKVIDAVKSELTVQASSISKSLVIGNKAGAEAKIVEIIRPIMLSAMKEISMNQIDDITQILDFTGVVSKAEEIDLASVVVNLSDNLKGLVQEGAFVKKDSYTGEADKKNGNTSNSNNIYRVVTGIAAIGTNVVAPWLEIVIILLPDIINLLKAMFGESSLDITKRQFIDNVIPQITNKMYSKVTENAEMTSRAILEEYQKMINGKIENIKNNLTEAQNKKNKKIEDFENYKITLSNDYEEVKHIISKMEVRNGD